MGDIVLYEGYNELNVTMVPIAPPVANLHGLVTDADTGSPLSGVTVTLGGVGEVVTNVNGEYSFEGLEPGEYVIQFTKEGYETIVR